MRAILKRLEFDFQHSFTYILDTIPKALMKNLDYIEICHLIRVEMYKHGLRILSRGHFGGEMGPTMFTPLFQKT